jgi:hypothetical protein
VCVGVSKGGSRDAQRMSGAGGSNSLEQVMIGMQQRSPGFWDGKLANNARVVYREAEHGPNPLGQGFSICVPYRPSGSVPAGTRLK